MWIAPARFGKVCLKIMGFNGSPEAHPYEQEVLEAWVLLGNPSTGYLQRMPLCTLDGTPIKHEFVCPD